MERIPNIRHEIPKGAVLITRHEALQYQRDIVSKWKPQSEVWWLTYGRPLLIGAASFSGLYINHRFRRKLKLLNYGSFPTMIGLTVGPALITTILHTEFILNKLMLLEFSCPLCLVSRSALYQCISGLLLPLIITPVANFSVTAGSGVYNTPHISDVKGIMKVVRSVYQPMIPTITLIFTLHALLAGFITHSQIKSILHIHDVQYLLEEGSKQ